MSNYKKLDVWILSMQTVKEIYRLTKSYPNEEKYGLISQTNRADVSIPSNIAEGLGRNYKKDTIQFFHISKGSAYELETLIHVAMMINLIDEKTYNIVNDIIDRNLRVINGYINYLEKPITANSQPPTANEKC
jgi:four helix bundle protein